MKLDDAALRSKCEAALDEMIADLQEFMGVTSGDCAGAFFSGSEDPTDKLVEYLTIERDAKLDEILQASVNEPQRYQRQIVCVCQSVNGSVKFLIGRIADVTQEMLVQAGFRASVEYGRVVLMKPSGDKLVAGNTNSETTSASSGMRQAALIEANHLAAVIDLFSGGTPDTSQLAMMVGSPGTCFDRDSLPCWRIFDSPESGMFCAIDATLADEVANLKTPASTVPEMDCHPHNVNRELNLSKWSGRVVNPLALSLEQRILLAMQASRDPRVHFTGTGVQEYLDEVSPQWKELLGGLNVPIGIAGANQAINASPVCIDF